MCATGPVIADPHAIDNDDSSSTAYSVFPLPPLTLLLRVLCFGFAVSKTPLAALGTNYQDDVVSKPCLELLHVHSVLAGKGFLQVDKLRFQVMQYMDVASWGGERKDVDLLFDQLEGLGVDNVEARVFGRGQPGNVY